jgi:(1->4)-alpha-D-glucan 1-alpha-D-glucosylmutase
MATTATHDTKWGGDVRARLALLSEQPQEWIEAVRRWSKMNEQKRAGNWPDRKMEYLFYQALVGSWPLTKDRALAYMEKAAREAKEHTRWRAPVSTYEEALRGFIGRVVEDSNFMSDVEKFVARIRDAGWINSLSQTLVKLTATGVPDIYQGSELWDLCVTDPDNRRPVDYALRRRMLNEAKGLDAEEVWRRRESGLPKLWLIWKVLNIRRRNPAIFGADAKYEPIKVSGAKASHVLAFMRGNAAISVTPRLACAFNGDWADTAAELPPGRWHNELTGLPMKSGLLQELTAGFPAAFLLKEESS